MNLWKKISLGILIFIVLLLGTIAFLFGTTSGLHLLCNIASLFIPGLTIGKVTGGWHNLLLNNIHYQDADVEVNASELHLAIKFSCLRDGKLCVDSLSSKDVNVKVNDTSFSVTNFKSGLYWQEKTLTLTPTLLQEVLISLPKEPDIPKNKIVGSKIRNLHPTKKLFAETLKDFFSKPIVKKITDIHLPINLNIEEFRGKHLYLTGGSNLKIFNMLIKAKSIDNNMKLEMLHMDTNQGLINATGNVLLRDQWPIKLTLNGALNIDMLRGEKVKLKIDGELRDKLELFIDLSGPINMVLLGKIHLAEPGLPLNLEILSKKLSWPFTGAQQFQIDDVKLKLNGKITNYTLSFQMQVKGQHIPPAAITINANVNEQQINLNQLTVLALEGKTKLTGLVNWQKGINWHTELQLTGLNTAKEVLNLPSSKLDGLIKTSGSVYGGNWRVNIPEIKFKGNVGGNKIKINGSLQGNSYSQWKIPGLYLALGSNIINIKGELKDKDLGLDTNVDAPNFSNILPELGGTAKGLIKIRGTIESPQILVNMTANSLRWKDLSIAYMKAFGDLKSTNQQIKGRFNLLVKHIIHPSENIRLITLSSQGSETQHNLNLRIQGSPFSGQLYLIGHFDRQMQRWNGEINNTRFSTPIGQLALIHTLSLNYHNTEKKISIGPHCWINQSAKLCIPKTIDVGTEGSVIVNVNRFDLKIMKPLFPDTMNAIGIFSGKVHAAWNRKRPGLSKGSLRFSGRKVKITKIINEIPFTLPFENVNLNVYLHNKCVRFGWVMRTTNNGQFEGKVEIHDPRGQRNLRGRINIHNFNLAIADTIFSPHEKIEGALNTNLLLAGNIRSPQVFGQIQFNNVNINSNLMPFNMKPSHLILNFHGMSSSLTGELHTSQGEISLIGDAKWKYCDYWRARVTAKGSRVNITIPPMAKLEISPDVVFEATPSLFTLNGSVDIPWGRIIVHDIPPNAVSISDDEIFLNKNLKPIKQKKRAILINSYLIVHIGNDVRLDAFGLQTRLTGDFKVVQNKQGVELNGQINIPEGRFHAYGQDLIVRKGELLFSGPPDQPMLNIEAIRNPDSTKDNVIAGVRVTGYTDKPKAEIFSYPAMSQQEALSYLLRGQGMNSHQSDNTSMTSILVGLGVSQSGKVVGKIGETLGVSNLSLSTEGIGDSSRVVVSGYVLPDLQVKYSMKIFDSLATLTLRYRLMPKLYLEVVSGVNQALDLLYQFGF